MTGIQHVQAQYTQHVGKWVTLLCLKTSRQPRALFHFVKADLGRSRGPHKISQTLRHFGPFFGHQENGGPLKGGNNETSEMRNKSEDCPIS